MTGPIDPGPGGGPVVRQCTGHITRGPEAGRRCRRSAVKGAVVCPAHGGAAPQVKAAAARRVAAAEVMTVYEKFSLNGSGPVDVLAALEALVGRVAGFADFATRRIETLTAQEWAAFGPRTAAEVDLFRQACRDAGRLLTDVARLGLDERALEARREGAAAEVWAQRRVAEQAAAAVGRILARLGYPNPHLDRRVGAVCAEEFARITGGAEAPDRPRYPLVGGPAAADVSNPQVRRVDDGDRAPGNSG